METLPTVLKFTARERDWNKWAGLSFYIAFIPVLYILLKSVQLSPYHMYTHMCMCMCANKIFVSWACIMPFSFENTQKCVVFSNNISAVADVSSIHKRYVVVLCTSESHITLYSVYMRYIYVYVYECMATASLFISYEHIYMLVCIIYFCYALSVL